MTKNIMIFIVFYCFTLLLSVFFSNTHSSKSASITSTVAISEPTIVLTRTPTPTYIAPTLSPHRLWDLVNDWRLENGYQSYTHDEQLCEVARIRVQDIQDDWSHNGFLDRIYHVPYIEAGENLASDMVSPYFTLDGWISSSSHLEQLQKPYTHSCIVTDGAYAVQLFARY